VVELWLAKHFVDKDLPLLSSGKLSTFADLTYLLLSLMLVLAKVVTIHSFSSAMLLHPQGISTLFSIFTNTQIHFYRTLFSCSSETVPS
jgi:hypothetical protein